MSERKNNDGVIFRLPFWPARQFLRDRIARDDAGASQRVFVSSKQQRQQHGNEQLHIGRSDAPMTS